MSNEETFPPTVNVFPAVSADPRDQLPVPVMETIVLAIAIPFVVMTFPAPDPVKDIELWDPVAPVYVKFVAGKVREAATERTDVLFGNESVIGWASGLPVFASRLLHLEGAAEVPVTETVNGPPASEFASKKTLSAAVGAEAPPAPPEVVAQFVVVEASQVPVPPTQ